MLVSLVRELTDQNKGVRLPRDRFKTILFSPANVVKLV